jgi:hypothetical protein
VETAAAAIYRVLPQLTGSDAHELVTAVTALAVRPPSQLPAPPLRGGPLLAHVVVDFVPRPASMTHNLITGMLVQGEGGDGQVLGAWAWWFGACEFGYVKA